MSTITSNQIRRIGTLRGILGRMIDDYDSIYYLALKENYHADSCKQLSKAEADELLLAMQISVNRLSNPLARVKDHPDGKRPGRLKYDDLEPRPRELASAKQLRKIEALWAEVSRAPTAAERTKALLSFIHNHIKIDRIEWVPRASVRPLIAAMQAMKKQRKQGATNVSNEEGPASNDGRKVG